MAQSYTAAIVGCGSIGHAHAEGYGLVDEVELVAVVDPLEAPRQQYMEEYDLQYGHETIEEMLEEVQPDIVSVCTWHLLHPAPTIAAARAGVKGIICEKPMAIGMAAADSMIEACAASGTKLAISHQRRFTPGWEKARALVEEKAIGEVVRVDNKVADSEAREARMLREEARTWLLSDSIDFRRVCQWALLEPEAVRDSARSAVDKCDAIGGDDVSAA